MKSILVALVAITGCVANDPIEPEGASDDSTDSPTVDKIHQVDCMPVMFVAGAGPYSVQCAALYSVSDAGVQVAYTATDSSGHEWVSARAAAPQSAGQASVVFAIESASAPALGALTVHARLISDAQSTTASSEMSATIDVRY
ncbi:MAG TPA: hypothetical protein VMZ53_14145 [Kofleriaceae bacterium]|nr:hypothetical protein [Kofleriaceae bacterium]